MRSHRVSGVTRNDIPVLRVTVTAFDIWHNAIVQDLRIPDPTQNIRLVEIKHWRYLAVRSTSSTVLSLLDGMLIWSTIFRSARVNRIASGNGADSTEIRFKISGDGGDVGDLLGPFVCPCGRTGGPLLVRYL